MGSDEEEEEGSVGVEVMVWVRLPCEAGTVEGRLDCIIGWFRGEWEEGERSGIDMVNMNLDHFLHSTFR